MGVVLFLFLFIFDKKWVGVGVFDGINQKLSRPDREKFKSKATKIKT